MNDKFEVGAPAGISVDKKSSSSVSVAILWITFAIVLLATVFLYLQSRSVQNAVLDKEATRDEIVSQLSSPSYLEVERQANGFKEAYNILAQVSGTQMPKKELLSELYLYFTKDITVRNLSLSAEGSLLMDGSTSSYRAVADFMTSLKSYSRVSDVSLGAVSISGEEGVAANKAVSFSVSCKVDTAKKAPQTSTGASDQDAAGEGSTSSDDLDPMNTYN